MHNNSGLQAEIRPSQSVMSNFLDPQRSQPGDSKLQTHYLNTDDLSHAPGFRDGQAPNNALSNGKTTLNHSDMQDTSAGHKESFHYAPEFSTADKTFNRFKGT